MKHFLKRYNEEIQFVFMILLAILFFGSAIWYSVYQFNLCYPDVSDSWWYCFQHAT